MSEFVSTSLLPSLGSLGLLLLGWIAQKYLVPLLSSQTKKKVAEHILLIADEVTSSIKLKYPQAGWASWIDQAVEEIMEITGVEKEIALRAAQAALSRQGIKK